MHVATETTTLLATGAGETATGSRLAMRGMIWFGFTFYRECVLGETKPEAMKRQIRAALNAVGRGKGECSTKATQAATIGNEFGALFGAELASDYADVPSFIQACFNAAEASGAGSVLRLVDLAKYGNANYKDDQKAAKAAENDAKRIEAEEQVESMASSATALPSMDLDATVQNLNPAEPETITSEAGSGSGSGLAETLASMSDDELEQVRVALIAEYKARQVDVVEQAA